MWALILNKILKNVQNMANIKYTAQCIKFIKKTNRFTYLLHSDH